MPTLLIVEDEEKLRKLLVRGLKNQPEWEILSAESAEKALEISENTIPDIVLTDLRLPGINGIDLMAALRKRGLHPHFVVMTAYASVGSAVEALRAGAVDYLIKPFTNDELVHVLSRIENEIRLTRENESLKTRLAAYEGPSGLIGESAPMQDLRKMISKVAPTQSTVLIRGESGTGKELIARAIHEGSGRCDLPLVRVNCGAIPENLLESELFGHVKGAFTGATDRRVGRFEMAGEGTIFLDEIGDLSLPLQVKLLRVLQDREYEPVGSSQTRTTKARVLAATNRDLEPAIQEGQFREDLYYRLNVVTIQAPPLCEHLEDLDLLVDHFVKRVASREGISAKEPTAECRALLSQWHWPGNVRELENVIESALIMGEGERLEADDLPAFLRKKQTAQPESGAMSKDGTPDLSRTTLDEMERHLILQALERSGGNQSEAARHLGVTRRTLNYRREKYGI